MGKADPDNEASFCECVIGSVLAETEKPKAEIVRALEGEGFSKRDIFGVKLALEEALTNAVKHGNCGDPCKCVTVRYAVGADRAVIIIRDEGGGFTPEAVPDPTAPERLPLPNGRGIMLMKAYMDEVTFRDDGREVRLVKRRQSGGGEGVTAESDHHVRRTVHFSGSVQGVGFRYTTRQIASRHDVTGYVKNLPDGRVELVVEGPAAAVERFQAAVEEAMGGYIANTMVSEAEPTGEFSSFRISH